MARLRLFCLLIFRSVKCQFVIIAHISCALLKYLSHKLNAFTTDLGEETGILAIGLTANRGLHASERCLWLFIVIASIFGAVKLSNLQIKRYLTSPTVIAVDRDYRGWNGSLPAVTLCYYDHIDSFKANEYIQNNWNVSIVDDDYFYFMDFLYAVVNATASNYADLARFAEDERFDAIDLSEVVRAIDRPFDQALSSFDDGNFTIEVTPVMTERGFCYALNSPISKILAGKDLAYEDMQQPLTCEFGKQQCFIKMDLFESTGAVEVHSPFEVSATDANVIPLHKSDEITASYKVLETVASKNLRELRVEQRKCVFHDEEISQLKVYSKTLCLVRCRAVMALEMCNCVPFFYAFVEGPSCNPAGFECLLDFKWPIWALHICKCPSTCTESEYTVQTVKKSYWGVKNNDDGVDSDVVTSSFRWDLIPPKVRMRRDVVFSFEDLLVSFGGALALFIGFSLLTITRLGFVLTYYVLEMFRDLFIWLRNVCGRVMARLKRRRRLIHVAERKSVNRNPLQSRRRQLVEIHQRKSNDDNLKESETAMAEVAKI